MSEKTMVVYKSIYKSPVYTLPGQPRRTDTVNGVPIRQAGKRCEFVNFIYRTDDPDKIAYLDSIVGQKHEMIIISDTRKKTPFDEVTKTSKKK